MTNNPSARAAGTMETIQWYEKAGLHCRTNHRQGSSFSLLRASLLFSIPSVCIHHDSWYIHPSSLCSSLRSSISLCAIQYRTAAYISSVSACVVIPDLIFFPSFSSLVLRTTRKESYAAEWALILERRLLRSTFLPPFVRAPVALRALLSHFSSAISQRC